MLPHWRKTARRAIPAPKRRCSLELLEPRLALSAVAPTVSDVVVSSTQWSEGFLTYLESHSLGTGGYSIPVGSSAQSAPLPWENINQIKITFSQDVDVQAADMVLSGVNTTVYDCSGFFYDPQSHIATWTLSAPIAADKVMIDLDANGLAPVRNLNGDVLDGEWQNGTSSYTSGNGTAGGDFEFAFEVLPGDVNQSGLVTYLDYVYTRSLDGKSSSDAGYIALRDINGSGLINASDWQDVLGFAWDEIPTGNPAGTNNDAPTTLGLDSVNIDDDATDVAISLWDAFDDAESSASGLTYSIKSISEPSLFDSVSINQSTGELVLNAASQASGRSTLTISATDTGGLSIETTISVDVDYEDQPPCISEYVASLAGANTWVISGRVSDPDDDTTGWTVNFDGVFDTRAAVWPDGRFEFAVIVDPNDWGWEHCITYDPHGLASNVPGVFIGVT
jgi:hypothetical protein